MPVRAERSALDGPDLSTSGADLSGSNLSLVVV
jgi:hypothetical protein